MSESGRELAVTIAKQFGGTSRLQAMIGAYNFLIVSDGLAFKFKAGTKANYIKITLNSLDLYDVKISKIINSKTKGLTEKIVAETSGLYNDMLVSYFEEKTGLYLSI